MNARGQPSLFVRQLWIQVFILYFYQRIYFLLFLSKRLNFTFYSFVRLLWNIIIKDCTFINFFGIFQDNSAQYSVTPVCLPWKSDNPGQDLTNLKINRATITGWGKITNNETESQKNYAEFQAATRYQGPAWLMITPLGIFQ